MVGSALSGLAWSAESLIVFRVLQGLGGGMIMPAGMTILTQAAGPKRVGQVMSVIGVPMLLGPILGPILGGWLVDDVSWRWIFFINIPIGIVALAVRRADPAQARRPAAGRRLDALGLALLSPGLAALIYGLAKSAPHGGFGHAEVLVPAIAGAAARPRSPSARLPAANPLIDLRLFKRRSFAAASGTMVMFVHRDVRRHAAAAALLAGRARRAALAAGLLLAPQGIGAMVTMPIGGQLTDRMGAGPHRPGRPGGHHRLGRRPHPLGADSSYWARRDDVRHGPGHGPVDDAVMSAAIQTLSQTRSPRASTTLNIIQQVGASIGTAVMAVAPRATRSPPVPPTSAGMADAFGHTFWWALALLGRRVHRRLPPPRARSPSPCSRTGTTRKSTRGLCSSTA